MREGIRLLVGLVHRAAPDAAIIANHHAGNMDLAGSLARELQELKADLGIDTQELAETEEAYQGNLRQAKIAQKRTYVSEIHRLLSATSH